jgi:uncharacterized protein
MKLNNQSSKLLLENKFKNKNLFLAMSNSMPAGMTDTAQARKDTSNATVGTRCVLLFHDILKNNKNKDLRWRFKYYDNERHSSVPLISSYDALKCYDGYRAT